jgi:hypothetical protein
VLELEFLPTWYPQARRRWRLFRLQTCSALLLCTGLLASCLGFGKRAHELVAQRRAVSAIF